MRSVPDLKKHRVTDRQTDRQTERGTWQRVVRAAVTKAHLRSVSNIIISVSIISSFITINIITKLSQSE